MPSGNKSPELFSVTALRGLAALGVVLFHVRVDLWVGWRALQAGEGTPSGFDRAVGWLSAPAPFLGSGVMLFFLISGFCIALPYAGEDGRRFRWGEYLARRLGRIYPPYLATLAFCVGVEWLTRSHLPGSPSSAILATAAMAQNYTTGQVVSNPSFWSLPVEVELYLVFPLVHLLLHRAGPAAVLAFTGAVSLAALGGYFGGFAWLDVNFAKYWVLWSAGAVLAEWYKRGNRIGFTEGNEGNEGTRSTMRSPPFAVLGAGVGVLILTAVGQLRGWPSALLHFGYGFFYFVLLWWAVARESQSVVSRHPPSIPAGSASRPYRHGQPPQGLRLTSPSSVVGHPSSVLRPPLLLLGTISYSLYLVHFPLFRLGGYYWVQVFGHKPVNFLIPLAFAILAVAAGWLFYRVVEAPSHALAKRLASACR